MTSPLERALEKEIEWLRSEGQAKDNAFPARMAFKREADRLSALLDSQPESPERCPTCGSDDPAKRGEITSPNNPKDGSLLGMNLCPDPFHSPEPESER